MLQRQKLGYFSSTMRMPCTRRSAPAFTPTATCRGARNFAKSAALSAITLFAQNRLSIMPTAIGRACGSSPGTCSTLLNAHSLPHPWMR